MLKYSDKNYKNVIVSSGDLCGWVFYENIYKIINIVKIDDENYEYILSEIHNHEYEPYKYNNSKLKKINWKKINKNYYTRDVNKLLIENYVYNSIGYKEKELKDFNILMLDE